MPTPSVPPSVIPRHAKLLSWQYLVFAMLTCQQSASLAEKMQELHYAAGEILVEEGDLVNSIYVIDNVEQKSA